MITHGQAGSSVTAVPDIGYHFVQWNDGNTNATRTVSNVTANADYTASFAINQYTVTFAAGANGAINGNSPQTVNHGGSATEITAIPDIGYHFVQWNDGNTNATRTVSNVTGNTDYTATFAINQYTVTFATGANGFINGTNPQVVNHGGSATEITAVPNTGYHFVQWNDGNTNATRTVSNVTGNTDYTATFAINQYTVTFAAGANGSLTGTAVQVVNHGGSTTAVTAVPDTGFDFVQWDDTNTNATRSVTNVVANMTVTAEFSVPPPIFEQTFVHDGVNRRSTVDLNDGSQWAYLYDTKGNLQSAQKAHASNPQQDKSFTYTFDDIGNRTTATEDSVVKTYTPNDLNQYSSINVGGTVENIAFDDSGNPLTKGDWDLTWDGEDRLKSMDNTITSEKLEFGYDFRGFRVWKKVYQNAVLQSWTGYLYDGRLVSQEIDLMNNQKVKRSYTWGLDPAGTKQEVGGIGALLSMEETQVNNRV